MKRYSITEIFPLDGSENLRATSVQDGKVITVHQSNQPDYCYVWFADGETGLFQGLKKPAHKRWLHQVLKSMGLNPIWNWNTEKANPMPSIPFLENQRKEANDPRVYFIEGAGLIKIGVADDPTSRLKQMQAMSPVHLILLATIDGGYELERKLHKQFSMHHSHGEWFESAPEILNFIRQLQK